MGGIINVYPQIIRNAIDDLLHRAVPYVAYPNNGNLGDEVLYHLASSHILTGNRLVPFSRFDHRSAKASAFIAKRLFILGGGTLLFEKQIERLFARLISAGAHPLLFGTGSRDIPTDEQLLESWVAVLKAAPLRGVRGYQTQKELHKLGIESEVVGDMAFLTNLDISQPVEPEDYVVLSIRFTKQTSDLYQSDMDRYAMLPRLVAALKDLGYKVILYSTATSEHEANEKFMHESLGGIVDGLVKYDGTLESFKHLVTKAKALITMRMHPAIFACSWGVPSIALERRSKYEDALSVVPNEFQILDPRETTFEQLLAASESLINESYARRKQRFDTVRKLTEVQKDYCHRISQTLSSNTSD